QRLLAGAAGEVDAQDAGVVAAAGALDARRAAVALLGPAADLVVVGRGRGLARRHLVLLRDVLADPHTHPGRGARADLAPARARDAARIGVGDGPRAHGSGG